MPGKWGGRAPGAPPLDSANELGCQANGGARAGRAPPLDPPMIVLYLGVTVTFQFIRDIFT